MPISKQTASTDKIVRLFPNSTAQARANAFPLLLSDTDRQVIDDGMRLVRSFLMIEDDEMRASILSMVEKVAEQNSIFKK